MERPAIFLDRDGVLNENRADYVRSWGEFRFLPDTFAALRALAALDTPIVVVTNQAGVGRGLISHEQINDIHHRMMSEITRQGARIDEIYWCPHTIADDCACRKPKPGMLIDASIKLGIDLSRSIVIGDARTDVDAGHLAGCTTVLVLTGRGRESASSIANGVWRSNVPDAIAGDLLNAVPFVRQTLMHATRSGARNRGSFQPHLQYTEHVVSHGGQVGEG